MGEGKEEAKAQTLCLGVWLVGYGTMRNGPAHTKDPLDRRSIVYYYSS
jgi:hypothetical protein